MQVKGAGDWWTYEGSQSVFIYSSWHLAPLSFRNFSTVTVKEVLLISKAEFTLFDIWSQFDVELQVEKA